MDSMCRNHIKNAIVIFELNKLRFHPCAPYPLPLTLPLPPPTLRSGGGGRERESLFEKGGCSGEMKEWEGDIITRVWPIERNSEH